MLTAPMNDSQMTQHRPDQDERRVVRRLALGGALQLIRTRHRWNVAAAAAAAGLAPMTWRRVEDGLAVRERTHAVLDGLLELPFGSVKRALADDLRMVEIVTLAGVDTRHVAADNAGEFLAAFAEQTRTGSPRQARALSHAAAPERPWPAVDADTRRALEALSQHVPLVRPTDLEVVQRMIDQLTRAPVTPAIHDLLGAALKALPDLISRQVRAACAELDQAAAAARGGQDPAEEQTAGT